MSELIDVAKDVIFVAAGSGVLWKIGSEAIKKILDKKEIAQSVVVHAGNSESHLNSFGSNGRVYATKEELSHHALSCASAIHEKINQNYQNLSNQINGNHKESMKVFADMKVDIAKLQSMRSGD